MHRGTAGVKKIVYILTEDPKERTELISSALAQALTSIGFGYECELFLMDRAVKLFTPEYIEGLKAQSFEPITHLFQLYRDLGGKIYGCNAAMAAHSIKSETCAGGITGFVNATKLLECSMEADAVFTY